MSPSRTPQALYLDGHGTTVFAVLHEPASPPSGTAVVLCPPFGWDDMCSYRVRREWAEELAEHGHPTLRLDLPGSGDSEGLPNDPARLDAWTASIDGAARWLRDTVGAQRLALIGIGLGGIPAWLAAVRGAPVDELVLWSVSARGRRALRELRTFSALRAARTEQPALTPAPEEEPDNNELAVNGYVLSSETVESLQGLDLAEIPADAARMSRALLLGRDGLRVDEGLANGLRAAGVNVSIADGPGYGEMMLEPQEASAPREVFARVTTWLQSSTPVAGLADRRPSPTRWRRAETLELPGGEAGIRERPIVIDDAGERLFGVLTEPLGRSRGLTALLLNAGPQRRTGPNRMWVEVARRWAAAGIPSLRLDAAGIGDSSGDASRLARIAAFYTPEYVQQARAGLDRLAEEGLPPRFLVVGLCAGAYWAAHAALADERVRGLIMLNPRTLVFDRRAHTARRVRELRQRALLAATWRKAFSGELRLARHMETGRTLMALAAGLPRRTTTRAGASSPRGAADPAPPTLEDLFDRLRERDQRGLLLFTGAEVLHRELAHTGALARIDRWPNLELEIRGTEADTHTLTPVWLQRQVHELLDRSLQRELQRLPANEGGLLMRRPAGSVPDQPEAA